MCSCGQNAAASWWHLAVSSCIHRNELSGSNKFPKQPSSSRIFRLDSPPLCWLLQFLLEHSNYNSLIIISERFTHVRPVCLHVNFEAAQRTYVKFRVAVVRLW
jgi:hypothetical protein